MSLRFRDDDDDSTRNAILGAVVGAVAGFAVGMLVAKKFGGIDGLTSAIRNRMPSAAKHNGRAAPQSDEPEEFDEIDGDEIMGEDYDGALEERVLSVFRNDPILSERAIDIASMGDSIIELEGSVESEAEAEHAVTVARGVPDVETVVNRLSVSADERRYEEAARRVATGDPSLTETQWEGNTVGTGRRRQGRSDEIDRHADPKVKLQENWSTAKHAVDEAADLPAETEPPRRGRAAKPEREVPRADHVE
jgi:hypothetical protein